MNTIETLQAAHNKLWAQRELTLPRVVGRWDNSEEPQTVTGTHGEVADFWAVSCADLVVTLHATIDAQLAVLTLAISYGDLPKGKGSSFTAAALELARAILGETP